MANTQVSPIPLALLSFALILAVIINHKALADPCETHHSPPLSLANPLRSLCIYEPTTIGYTHDSDDVSFMDFKVSLRYQLFPDDLTNLLNRWSTTGDFGNNSAIYFAFTGRFGQYIGTRDSSPVVEKRFNPKLFFRHWLDKGDRSKGPLNPDHFKSSYFDFGYAHESNGQSIHTQTQYDSVYNEALTLKLNPNFVNDLLSRGWDDLEFTYKNSFLTRGILNPDVTIDFTNFIQFRYFLRRGLMQGREEDYNPDIHFDPQGKPRRQVDGVQEAIKGIFILNGNLIKYYISINTGYAKFLRYKTYRFELSKKIYDLPLTLWYQSGYNSDLAQYYKKVDSIGLFLDLGSF